MKELEEITVYKGDSTVVKEFTIEGYPTLDNNWTGKKVVRASLNTTNLIDTVLDKAQDDSMFYGYLNPAETLLLDVGVYTIIYEIENLTISPQFRREIHYKLVVEQHGVD